MLEELNERETERDLKRKFDDIDKEFLMSELRNAVQNMIFGEFSTTTMVATSSCALFGSNLEKLSRRGTNARATPEIEMC